MSLFKKKAKAVVVGLEIRADGLALAIVRLNKQKQLNVDRCYFLECNAAEREKTLKAFVNKHGLEGAVCRVVLPSEHYKIYPVEKPNVEDSELADAARWKIKDLLDFDLADAVTDTYEFPADALRGRSEQVNVVASRSALIQNVVNLVLACDLELESIDISELAICNIAKNIEVEGHRSVSVLYLRHGAGMMVLVKEGMLYFSRSFDFSIQALNDVSQQDSVIQHLALEIQRSFDYFESQLGQVPPRVVHLIGPAPNMPLANMLGGGIAAQVENFDLTSVLKEDAQIGNVEIQAFAALSAALREEAA